MTGAAFAVRTRSGGRDVEIAYHLPIATPGARRSPRPETAFAVRGASTTGA
jgi:hypothetical protein